MNRILVVILFVVMIACVPVCAATQRQLAERGAFLSYRADSVSALVTELSANPKVAARYARHFGMTPETVTNYFKANLKLITLQKPLQTPIYFISKNGSVKLGKRLLPAGSRVFAAQKGELILEWRCGNPLVDRLPKPPEPKVLKPVIPTVATETSLGELENPVSTAVLPSVEEMATATIPPTITGIEPAAEIAASAPVAAVPPFLSAKALPWLAPLLLGATRITNNHPAPNVPEPASLMALSTGLVTAAFTWRRRRRK